MAHLHRNSQKRIYQKNGIYFVTSKTKDNYPYFKEKILCELWIEELRLCKKLKKFELLAFCLLSDHFHLLVLPKGRENISRIMKFLKENFSRDANKIITTASATAPSRLQLNNIIKSSAKNFIKKYKSDNSFPRFQWQKSFHDHLIRDDSETDYHNHYEYTVYNHLKHSLPETWQYTSLNYPDLIDEILV